MAFEQFQGVNRLTARYVWSLLMDAKQDSRMDYFKVDFSVDKNEVGSQFPQVQKMTKGYDYDALNSVHALSRFPNEFPQFTPNLDSFVLHRGAKLTDLLSTAVVGGVGLLVSQKLMKLLSAFKLVPHTTYKATVVDKDSATHQYVFLQIIVNNFSNKVDYSRSEFYLSNVGTNEGEIKLNSLDHLIAERKAARERLKKPLLTIKAKKIVLDNIASHFDLFAIGGFDFEYYLSENVKEELNRQSITGFDLSKKAPFHFTDM